MRICYVFELEDVRDPGHAFTVTKYGDQIRRSEWSSGGYDQMDR